MAMRKIFRNFCKVVTAVETSPIEMVGKELAESLEEYSSAMNLIQEKNWPMAELELHRCLEIIEKAGFYAEPSYNFVLKRLALTQRAQRKFPSCEKTLEEIVKNYKATEKNYSELLEKSYETLFKQYLSTNIAKALKLGEFLIQENNWKNLSREYQKDVKFYFGVIF